MKQKFLILMLLACFVLPAQATDKFYYVDPALISPEFIAPPIPATTAIIDDIISRQNKVTDADLDAITFEAKMRSDMLALNNSMSRKAYPHTYELLDKAGEDCKTVVSNTKSFWNTDRPYTTDKRIKSLTYLPGNAAYPSGHTACSRVMAEILGQLAPSKRAAFRSRAAEIAEHRVMGGLHWPNDLVGGEQLALLFFGALQTSENYQNDLAVAKKEWK